MNIFRRLPIYRLLLLCAVAVAVGISATAIAFALGSASKPPPKPLAVAIHDALAAPRVEGVSANIKLTNHLLEGANIASEAGGRGGELLSSPLITGASGRLWIARDGRARLELQAEKGDTQVIYDGHTLTAYDASTNTLYRYVPEPEEGAQPQQPAGTQHEVPSVAKIEEAIAHVSEHAVLSGATPSDVAGHPAYTARIAPKEGGSLIGGAELSFDADHGTPLRAAVYSSTSPSPVAELAATEVSYGPIADSVFAFTPPPDAKVQELRAGSSPRSGSSSHERPRVRSSGHGITSIVAAEHAVKSGEQQSGGDATEGLPKVDINGASATELRTALGTVLSFERGGVRYLVAGWMPPASIEGFARGL